MTNITKEKSSERGNFQNSSNITSTDKNQENKINKFLYNSKIYSQKRYGIPVKISDVIDNLTGGSNE